MKKLMAIIVGLPLILILLVTTVLSDDDDPCGGGSASDAVIVGDFAYPTELDKVVVSSGFGWRTWDTGPEFHDGIDLAGPAGTHIFAFADGRVVQAADSGVQGFGGWVIISHNIDGQEVQTVYGHMYPGGVHVNVGDRVTKGQYIADMGSAGFSTGPHLHFEVVKGERDAGGEKVDPQPWLDAVGKNADSAGELVGTSTDGGDSGSGESTSSGAASGVSATVEAVQSSGLYGLSARQLTLAKQIVAIGEVMGMDDKAVTIALATAWGESTFQNYASDGSGISDSGSGETTYEEIRRSLDMPHDAVAGDHSSVGTFQQQVGLWGSVDDLMNPAFQAKQFYEALAKIDYQSMDVATAAASVQRNAGGAAYYRQFVERATGLQIELAGAGSELSAEEIAALGTASLQDICATGGFGDVPLTGHVQADIIAAAESKFGTPYAWGGGDFNGPTGGGFDCSGLVLYAVAQATGGKVKLPHNTVAQINSGLLEKVPIEQMQPGDLLYYGAPGAEFHAAIYGGEENGQKMMLEAQQSGVPVGKFPLRTGSLTSVMRVKDIAADNGEDPETSDTSGEGE